MPPDIAEQLRREIAESGETVNAIAKATGVSQPTLSRFMSGRDISLRRAAKVAAYLGLSLHKPKK